MEHPATLPRTVTVRIGGRDVVLREVPLKEYNEIVGLAEKAAEGSQKDSVSVVARATGLTVEQVLEGTGREVGEALAEFWNLNSLPMAFRRKLQALSPEATAPTSGR